MSIKRSRFPSSQRRFCTSELKIKPMIDYILSLTEPCVIIQGIRAKESEERAKLPMNAITLGSITNALKRIAKERLLKYGSRIIVEKMYLNGVNTMMQAFPVRFSVVGTRSNKSYLICRTKAKSFVFSWIFPCWLLSLYYVSKAGSQTHFTRRVRA